MVVISIKLRNGIPEKGISTVSRLSGEQFLPTAFCLQIPGEEHEAEGCVPVLSEAAGTQRPASLLLYSYTLVSPF